MLIGMQADDASDQSVTILLRSNYYSRSLLLLLFYSLSNPCTWY